MRLSTNKPWRPASAGPYLLGAALAIGLASSAQAEPQLRGGAPDRPESFLTPKPNPDARPADPFGSLFGGKSAEQRLPVLTRTLNQPGSADRKPRVACGTVVIPADPAFDAKIRRDTPVWPKPSVRAITPTCP